MAGNVFLRLFPVRFLYQPTPSFRHVDGRIFTIMARTLGHSSQNGDKGELSFEAFKRRHIESFKTFVKNPYVKEVTKGDMKKTKKAYEDYCRSKYAEYKQGLYGGHPGTMV